MKLYELGKKIKILRKDKSMTQEELAVKCGISRVTLGKIERGEFGAVSVKTLDLILFYLGLELEFKTLEGFGLGVLGNMMNT